MSNTQFSPHTQLHARALKTLRLAACVSVALAGANLFAAAPYLRAERPIIDSEGRVKVIVDFTYDAHLRYPGALPTLPARNSAVAVKEFFHTPKSLALVTDYELRYGFARIGMTSWVGNSVTAYLPAQTISRLLADPLVKQVSDDSYHNLSQMPGGGWINTSVGNEWTSWGHQAVNGKISTGNTGRKIYIIDSGVAYHDDLPAMTRRNVACGGSGTACNQINPSLWPEVGCYAHATHVAGIIGAIANNDKTMKGAYAGFPNLVSLAVTERQGASYCGDKIAASGIGNALDYIAYDATQNNPDRLVHIATMSINTGGTAFIGAQPEPNWQKVKSLTTTIWSYGVPVQPGVFFVQSAGNYPDVASTIQPQEGCLTAYRPDANVDALADDGVMVVSASHNTGGGVTLLRPFTQYLGPSALPDYELPSNTFPYSQTDRTTASHYGPCTDIYAPGNLILSTWGMHAKRSPNDNAIPSVSSSLATVSYSGSVSFPVVYGAHVNNAYPTMAPLPTQGWAFLSGTSMSAPFVAAAAAWLADVYGYATPGELELAVRANVTTATDPNADPAAPIPPVPVIRLP